MRPLDPALAIATVQSAYMTDRLADGPKILRDCPVALLGIRMGRFGKFDDMLAMVHRAGEVRVWRGNTQPGATGINKLIGKPYAQLCEGVWPSIKGRHKLRPNRFRQPNHAKAAELGLRAYFRDARALGEYKIDRLRSEAIIDRTEWGTFSINVHEGPSETRTGSAGCITAPPSVYFEMRDAIYAAMAQAGQAWLPLVIVAGPL